MKTLTWKDAFCPWCQVMPGADCKNPDGSRYQYVHSKRFDVLSSMVAYLESKERGES